MLKKPDDIRHAYSDTATAEEYIDKRFTSAWGSVMHAAQVKTVNETIRAHRVQRVLELAPGPARLSRDVSGFAHGYLCEFNDSMLQVARRRLTNAKEPWHLVRGDAFHLPFQGSASLDLVYTFRFIRHFESADRTSLYRQIHSVLKPGGLFIFDAVSDVAGRAARTRDDPANCPVYDEFYTRESLTAELAAHGFTTLTLVDVIRHMWLQQQIQVLVGPRSNGLAKHLISLLERVPGEPLEWVVVCRK